MKRFIDDRIWLDVWFSELTSDEKLIWIYLFTNCSKVGLWEENKKEIEYRLRKKLNWESIKEHLKEKVEYIGNFWHLRSFIEIQYPRLLDYPDSPLHVSIFRELVLYGLKLIANSLSIDYTCPIHSHKVRYGKDKEQVRLDSSGCTLPEKQKTPIDFAVDRFREHRRAMKRPLTMHAEKLLLSRLFDLAKNEEERIKIIDQSIMQGWQGIFPLKTDSATSSDPVGDMYGR